MKQMNTKSISEKFPPPHQDATIGYPLDISQNGPVSFGDADDSFNSTTFNPRSSQSVISTSSTSGPPSSKKKNKKEGPLFAPSRRIVNTFLPSSVRLSLDLRFKGESESESENFQQTRRE